VGRFAAPVLAAALALGAAWALFSAERPPPPLRPGQPAPDFSLPALSGGERGLLAPGQRLVLVNFWATWCKPCEEEMPAMQRLWQALAPEGFELLAVSVDAGRAEVEAFRERLALGFPILLDPGKQVAARYQTFRFPESFLVDARGVLVARYVGPRRWDAPEYRARLRRLLAEFAADRYDSPPRPITAGATAGGWGAGEFPHRARHRDVGPGRGCLGQRSGAAHLVAAAGGSLRVAAAH